MGGLLTTALASITGGAWRLLLALAALPAFLLLLPASRFVIARESPRWLLTAGREAAACDLIRRIAEADEGPGCDCDCDSCDSERWPLVACPLPSSRKAASAHDGSGMREGGAEGGACGGAEGGACGAEGGAATGRGGPLQELRLRLETRTAGASGKGEGARKGESPLYFILYTLLLHDESDEPAAR